MTPDQLSDFPWLSPANYHSRCTDAVTRLVATDILMGATWQSATKKYGVRHRALEWMRWGYEAAKRDEGPDSNHATYLNWYLKLSQALGFVEAAAQQKLYRESPATWLRDNPEVASAWGVQAPAVSAIDQASVETVAATQANVATAPVDPKAPNVRTVLRMLIEAGAAIPLSAEVDSATTIDAESPATQDGTGTHG